MVAVPLAEVGGVGIIFLGFTGFLSFGQIPGVTSSSRCRYIGGGLALFNDRLSVCFNAAVGDGQLHQKPEFGTNA